MAPSHALFHVLIDSAPFNLDAEINKIRMSNKNIGAIVTFNGLCRDEAGSLSALEIEHYPGMAEKAISAIAQNALERWPLQALTIIHRYGKIAVGDDIVLVITASPHRQAAFEAASFIMDFLKTDAPFWKKEHRKDGTATQWVEAKEHDDTIKKRW